MWHYQLMRHYNEDTGEEYFGIHEYFPEVPSGYTTNPEVISESVEGLKWQLKAMLEDIDKHGVKQYE